MKKYIPYIVIAVLVVLVAVLYLKLQDNAPTVSETTVDSTNIAKPAAPINPIADSLKKLQTQLALQDSIMKANTKKDSALIDDQKQTIKALSKHVVQVVVKQQVDNPQVNNPTKTTAKSELTGNVNTVMKVNTAPKVQDVLCDDDGSVQFCLHLDNSVYWPHSAMINGIDIPEAVKNPQGTGYNLRITSYSSSMTGDYGAIKDPETGLIKIIYVKSSRLEPYSNIEMRNNLKSWDDQPMEEKDGYSVWYRN
ncbi:MAG: hypothetical protein WC453_02195 [Patescibacteria group bacterium]